MFDWTFCACEIGPRHTTKLINLIGQPKTKQGTWSQKMFSGFHFLVPQRKETKKQELSGAALYLSSFFKHGLLIESVTRAWSVGCKKMLNKQTHSFPNIQVANLITTTGYCGKSREDAVRPGFYTSSLLVLMIIIWSNLHIWETTLKAQAIQTFFK